jgi:hypothetical protein
VEIPSGLVHGITRSVTIPQLTAQITIVALKVEHCGLLRVRKRPRRTGEGARFLVIRGVGRIGAGKLRSIVDPTSAIDTREVAMAFKVAGGVKVPQSMRISSALRWRGLGWRGRP